MTDLEQEKKKEIKQEDEAIKNERNIFEVKGGEKMAENQKR